MTARAARSSVRAALSRLPRWLTALGVVLVLGELTGGVLLAAGPADLVALGPHRTVVLKVDGGCYGDRATYRTPTGNGHFDITLGQEDGPPDCYTHGGFSGTPLTKTVTVPAEGTVTVTIYNHQGLGPLTCSIVLDGGELDEAEARDGGESATCGARIP